MKHLLFHGGKSDFVTVFLHGFPGVRSKQNRDIAELAAKTTGGLSILPLYSGLGFSEGPFSFEKCRTEVEDFIAGLLLKHEIIQLVGHSWGGYLSLGLAAKHGSRVASLILMSPLLHFFETGLAARSFAETATNNPQLDLGSTQELAKEFVNLGRAHPATDLASLMSDQTRVSILQAAEDNVTPPRFAEDLVPFFKRKPTYRLVATDHSFLVGRNAAVEEIVAEIVAERASAQHPLS